MGKPQLMNRREWLSKSFFYGTIGTVFATLGGIFLDVWLAAGKFTSAHWTEVAPVDAFKREGAFPFPEKRAAIICQNQQLAALSLECTHLGCLVHTVDQGFFCPCHGSEFGPLGEVYSRPAKEPLKWHAIQLRSGRIWIHTGKKLPQPRWVSPYGEHMIKQREKA